MTFPPLPQGSTRPTNSGAFYEWSGQGISLTVDDDIYKLYWFTYGSRGNPRWYFGTFIGSNPDHLYTTTGGRFNEKGCTETYEGTGRIYFLPDGTGVFNYNTDEHGRGSILLKRRLVSQRGGVYYDPALSGQGFSVHLFDGLHAATAYWFTYVNGEQRWYLATGLRNENYVGEWYELKIYEYLDGVFGYPKQPIESECGKILMVVTDGKIGMTYDLDAVGIKASGKYSLVKL